MLKNTFCHLPGVGARFENSLWESGIFSWDDVLAGKDGPSRKRSAEIKGQICESAERLKCGDAGYFSERLHQNALWRLFPEFRDTTAYLDIETNGLMGPHGYITTIALYDGTKVYYFVRGHNLSDFCDMIGKYKVIVTYNGRCFDIPFIEKSFGIRLDQAHIDLRFMLRGLGFKGGLKGCERGIGISRGGLDGLDGYFAVLLWNDYLRKRDERTLKTLLAYNIEDTVNLERLLIRAYNMKLRETPFERSHAIPEPGRPSLPFRPDEGTIRRIKGENCWYFNAV